MDTDRFEMFLRSTKFSESILAELWIEMSTLEKIDFMLYCRQSMRSLPSAINVNALDDSSSLVRMLASKSSWKPTELESKLINKINEDPRPFVRATTKYCAYDKLIEMPHEERLAVIALSGSLTDGDQFAKFIVTNLENKSLLEKEAGELVNEYVSNPAAANYVKSNPIDGMDWYGITSAFKAIWELTILTTPQVSDSIIWKYSLVSCDTDTIPDDILKKMDVETLSKLVWRGYQPLINDIKKNPETFDEKLAKAVADVEELNSTQNNEPSEIEILREELTEYSNEIRGLLNEALTRKRGFF